MSILYDVDAMTQAQDRQFAQAADILTDAEAARELIAYLDAKFGNPSCIICCDVAAADGVYCYECQPQRMPQDFAAGLADVANGASWCPVGVDWAAVEDEAIGD